MLIRIYEKMNQYFVIILIEKCYIYDVTKLFIAEHNEGTFIRHFMLVTLSTIIAHNTYNIIF